MPPHPPPCSIQTENSQLADPQDPTLQITTSTRSDITLLSSPLNTALSGNPPAEPCQFYMLSYHRDRMLAAAADFGWIDACKLLDGEAGLGYLRNMMHEYLASMYGDANYPGPLKLRILLPPIPPHNLTLTATPTPPVPLSLLFPSSLPLSPSIPQSFTLHLSPCLTTPSPYTTHKTTHRAAYNHARSHLPSPPSSQHPPAEILLRNTHGAVMEGSITTPYFHRNGTWVTPAATEGGNRGTTRRWALETGLCGEGVVMGEEVRGGEVVWVSNGVRGWGCGRVELGELREGVQS